MIPHDKDQRNQMVGYMLKYCLDNIEKLSKWEENFINSIGNQWDDGKDLTDRQCEILEKIYDKI